MLRQSLQQSVLRRQKCLSTPLRPRPGSLPQTCSGTHLQLRKIILKVLPDAFDASECWHVVNMRFEHLSRRLNEHLHRCRCSTGCTDCLALWKGRSGLRGTNWAKARGMAARLWFESLTLMSVEQLLDAEGASQQRPLLFTCLAVPPDLS